MEPNYKESLVDVLKVVYRWRKPIIIVCGLAAIGSIIISLMMPNYYKSTTVIYPTNPSLSSPSQIFGTTEEVNYFGEDEDVNRILTIANSTDVVGFLIKKFNLMEHYDIDSTDAKADFKTQKQFKKLYEVVKDKYDNIQISVEDTDKDLATKIVNQARGKVDDINKKLILVNQEKLLKAYEENVKSLEKNLSKVSDSLTILRKKYGIYDIESQSELLAKIVSRAETNLVRDEAKLQALLSSGNGRADSLAMLRARIAGFKKELSSLTDANSTSNINLKRFNDGISKVKVLTDLQEQITEDLSRDREKYYKVKSAFASDIASIHTIEVGVTPINKSRPMRSIIVLGSIVAALVFSLLGVLILEGYHSIDWKEVTRGE